MASTTSPWSSSTARISRSVLHEASNCGGLDLAAGLAMVMAIADGLHHAHERRDARGNPLRIVHRDVTPSNVVVGFDGAVKLADFGIAKALAATRQTTGEELKGKLGYMSPEQCQGLPLDRRSDVFALGVILYEATTGHRLFASESHFSILNKVMSGSHTAPSSLVPGYPVALEHAVEQALAVDPAERWPTALALRDALQAIADAEGLRADATAIRATMLRLFGERPLPPLPEVAPVADPPGHAPAPRRPRGALRTLLVAAGALGVGFGLASLRSTPQPEASPAEPEPTPAAIEPPGDRLPADCPAPAAPARPAATVPPVDAEPEPPASETDAAEPATTSTAPTRPEPKRVRKARSPRAGDDSRLFPPSYYEGR